MASKWHGQPCTLCGAGTLLDGAKTIMQEYKGQLFNPEDHGAFCDRYAEGFVEFDAAEETAWLAFRDRVDAAEAAELARIRKKLKLTQMEAAQLAGGGKNAFSRYERGQAKKQKDTHFVSCRQARKTRWVSFCFHRRERCASCRQHILRH